MVDSSVGGKVGVNHPRGKNLVGAFHQPVGVWIDIGFLATLPDREYRSGLAEAVKYGMILDAEFFAYLEANAEAVLARTPDAVRHVVARCCRLKADVVQRDEREESALGDRPSATGPRQSKSRKPKAEGRWPGRAVLNYGHTFAHAFETVGGYGALLHGEAVAAGMACAARLATERGLISSEVRDRQDRLLDRIGLLRRPARPEDWPVDQVLSAMRSDKKNVGGRLRLVLPRRLGDAALFDDVSEAEVRQTLEHLGG
jgi:3-dehydroquinate synthase